MDPAFSGGAKMSVLDVSSEENLDMRLGVFYGGADEIQVGGD